MYRDNKEIGGRPHNDEIVMVKMLVLAGWHGLSDYEVELLATDRLSFRHFLGYPEKIPDRSTIWVFRENLTNKGKIHLIWDELKRQLDEQGYSIKRCTIQDESFITSDPGHAPADKPRGDTAKTRRSRDGTWARKGTKSEFGYKLHSLIDKEFQFIRRFDTSTASLHDSQIDLSKEGEVVYRDKGYFGVKPLGFDATMKRGVRNHPIGIWDKLRNKRISRKRAPGERPCAVIKTVFKSAHTMVTTIARVHAKMIFAAMSFNICNILTFKHHGVI
jgi:IS5 family transposase